DWAKNTSVNKDDYYGDEVLLSIYVADTGTVESSVKNSDGQTWTVKYRAKDQNQLYTFIIDEIGNIVNKKGGISLKSQTKLKKYQEEILEVILDGITGNVSWESSAPEVVSVTGNGTNATIKALGDTGSVVIKAKIAGTIYEDTCTVTIVQKVTTISAEAITVEEGKTKEILVTTTPTGDDVEDLTYTYESNGTAIATVDSTGKVTGVAAGSTTIIVTGKNEDNETVATTCAVTVTEPILSYYGTRVVTGVTSVNGQTLADNWKIFYADENNVYLIYGDYYPANVQTEIASGNTICIPAHTYNSTTKKYDTDSTYTYSVNSLTDKNTLLRYLKNNTGYDYTSYTENGNYDSVGVASAAASQYTSWKNLLTAFGNGNNLAKKATSVQGSPTFEMWVDSWNEKYNATDGKVAKLRTFVKGSNTNGYLIGDTSTTPTTSISNTVGNQTAQTGYYDTLYYPYRSSQTTAYGYWLASPGGSSAYTMCGVGCNGNVYCDNGCSGSSRAARPVVSIPKSDFNAQNVEGITID
ncbi:MAG: Ig-like domain-containing protein, partial [Lachnospiraceae bacterium]|nr:Ig-like domain-containing protein [Lachnospiraceae bacterium]